jgi:hypothetical protein
MLRNDPLLLQRAQAAETEAEAEQLRAASLIERARAQALENRAARERLADALTSAQRTLNRIQPVSLGKHPRSAELLRR